jgi:hypothetical protein
MSGVTGGAGSNGPRLGMRHRRSLERGRPPLLPGPTAPRQRSTLVTAVRLRESWGSAWPWVRLWASYPPYASALRSACYHVRRGALDTVHVLQAAVALQARRRRPRLRELRGTNRRARPGCRRCGEHLESDRTRASNGRKLPSARPSKGEFEETFPSFKEGVSNAISPDDAASHADLAVAYAEMGLRADALREAGIALTITSRSPVTQVALRVLFGSALMTPSGLRALQRRLRK